MISEQTISNPKYVRRRILWKAVNRQRARFIKPITKLWADALRDLLDGTIDTLQPALNETYTTVGISFATNQYKRLNTLKADDPSLTNALNRKLELYVTDQLGELSNSIKGTTLEAAAVILSDNTITDAEKFELIDDLISRRSAVIAQNEVVAASNAGQTIGAEYYVDTNADFTIFKTWIATIDSRVRDAHEAADGQTVREKDYFNVGGELLFRPQDPGGSAANVINCRCTTDYFKQKT